MMPSPSASSTAQEKRVSWHPHMASQLRGLLTYNVWFGEHEFEGRAEATLRLIERARPAVVALQEVTPPFLRLLLREAWAAERYAFSTTDVNLPAHAGGVDGYGALLLVDRTLCPSFEIVELQTAMDRTLVLATLQLPGGQELKVGTVHLESLGTQPTREHQLRRVAQALGGGRCPAVLVGDFNFDERRCWSQSWTCASDGVSGERTDNDCLAEILPGWVDLWPALRPGELGFTFDSETNCNAAVGAAAYEQMRYDRVMVGPGMLSTAAAGSIELVGTEVDAATGCPPSDHYGLMVDWDLSAVRDLQEHAAPVLVPGVPGVPPVAPPPTVMAGAVPTLSAPPKGKKKKSVARAAPPVKAAAGLGVIAGFDRAVLRPTDTVFTSKNGTKRTVTGLAQHGDAAETIKEEAGERPNYLQSTSEKQLESSSLSEARFDVEDTEAWQGFLDREGYVVIAEAAGGEAEVSDGIDRLWSCLESRKQSEISRHDPATWESCWPGNQSNGIVSGEGICHSEFAWGARTYPNVLEAFSGVWGVAEEDLIGSMDGINLVRPTEPELGGYAEWKTQGGWWHVDQSTLCGHVGRSAVQGLLSYTDADETTGGLCVIPRSHHQHEGLCERVAQGLSDFVPVPVSDPVLSTPGRLVCCKAGDLVLWDSRTVHCNTPAPRKPRGGEQLAEPSLKRIVAYVCHVPRSFATEATVARRQEAFRSQTGSTHWPQHLSLGAPGDAYGLPRQSLEDAPRAVQRLVGESESMQERVGAGAPWQPSAAAMAAMEAANVAEAEGDLPAAKRWIAEAERLGHTLLAEHGGWR